jgi:hypothetical protein
MLSHGTVIIDFGEDLECCSLTPMNIMLLSFVDVCFIASLRFFFVAVPVS